MKLFITGCILTPCENAIQSSGAGSNRESKGEVSSGFREKIRLIGVRTVQDSGIEMIL